MKKTFVKVKSEINMLGVDILWPTSHPISDDLMTLHVNVTFQKQYMN